ncbi:Eco57I restriction-modification methylase domain-containing protein [Hymenobacter sediminicola]|uniref:site-specific DNA-methyltransferase (adenine-specific) n=1 Tax=Hymenobacter sediminicola TaxID=2761579 RepID=A0A7G7W2N8_9BACT|nr:N-6 DNA methylase [Hymenobacter sediminicola]QNH60631.1 N-6 DNA methylase [Hymenobacter sediminicola]
MPALLPLFPAATLPAPFSHFDPAAALPDFADRVRHLRRWQQAIASGYVRSRKEEVLQAEFLNLLFGEVLGYEYQATDHRQLQLELKTLTDGTKPDGALGEFVAAPGGSLGGPVRAVVELKDARTSLDAKQRGGAGKGRQETPVEQAFSYPSKFGASCRWVLVSNFLELRLYSAQDQSRAEVFNLETLPDQPEQLRRFFALLLPTHLLPPAGRAEALLDEALQQRQQEETKITKAFYKDYSTARRQLLDHLIEQNPTVPPLDLLAHTQKLLDRVIFVCFCEDKNIIPRLTFRRLLDAVRQNVFDPADDKVYRTVRGLFHSIDKGNPLAGINRFNGGLFAEDAALDALLIKDRTLTPVIQLEQYDFASDLNVNILGHIFEQSLSDLEQERARLSGQAHDPRQGKRKQDGIFYTPEYITRYIVQQAVGGWLQERRREAGLDTLPELTDDDRATIRIGAGNKLVQPSARVQRHIAAWEQYGQRLEGIRVLDPACGSGAFLNEAFGYLLREGEQVNRELAGLRAGQYKVFDFDRHILQHNLYGVDLNPESVDITRLSLWLQTANPGKPLTSLDHSIRCGNSLISDPAVAGPRAFDWQAAFPEVFAQGGFDVVIGNPPYATGFPSEIKRYFTKQYETAQYQLDLYLLFIERGIKILNPAGFMSYIVPNSWMKNMMMSETRRFMLEHLQFLSITPNLSNVFPDASVDTMIYIAQRQKSDHEIKITEFADQETVEKHSINQERFLTNDNFIFNVESDEAVTTILAKARLNSKPLSELFDITRGINPYDKYRGQSEEVIRTKAYHANHKKDETFVPEIRGKHVGRYSHQWDGEHYISYGEWLAAPRDLKFFKGKRLVLRQVLGSKLFATVIEEDLKIDQSIFIALPILPENELSTSYVQAIVASGLMSFYFRYSSNEFDDLFPKIKIGEFKELPIKLISPTDQQPFIEAAESLLAGHKELHQAEAKAARLVRAELGLREPLSGKLALSQPWPVWSTALEKALGRKLSLSEKSNWVEYFTEFQAQQQQQRATLHQQDAALDQLVYQLYQLTPAEIALVEGRPAPTK